MANVPKSRLNLDGLRKVVERIDTVVEVAVVNTAIQVAIAAAENAPKDTTYLANSIHVEAVGFSQYDASKAASTSAFLAAKAVGKTPKGHRLGPKSDASYRFFPPQRPDNPLVAYVVVGAVHGLSNENGVSGRKQFLAPAVYANRGTLTSQIRTGMKGLSVRAELSNYSKIQVK